MISSKNECFCIRDLSDLTLQIIFDARWASMNEGFKRPIAQNNSRHAPSWQFYLHCGIEATCSPGIICIVCHQVLRHPSEHGTSSIGKHLLAKAHIVKLNQLPESEVTELTGTTVDETALAIWKRQGSRGITIVSWQRKFRFDIQLNPYWPKRQIKRSKLADKHCDISEFHQDTWNHYLILGFFSSQIPCNAISNLQLRWSYKALRDDLLRPSATTLSNICCREYAVTMDAIKKQLPYRNKVSLALDGWTPTNKLAITSVIAYHMDRNWALGEVQLTFDEVDRQIFSRFESWLRMIGQGTTYCSKTSCTFAGCAGSFGAHQRSFAQNYHGYRFLKLLDDTRAALNTWGLWNRVACIEEPHTMYGTRNTAGCRCIHEHSKCKRPHKVLGSLWARSVIWRELKHRHREESKNSKRGQC